MNRRDRKMSKAAKRRERIRHEKHATRQQQPVPDQPEIWEAGPDEEISLAPDETPALPPISLLGSERVMGKLHSLLTKSGAKDIGEAKALLDKLGQNFFGDSVEEPSDDPLEQAQQLAYDAMEAASAREARKLIDQALALDPDCVDALVHLAETARGPGESLELAERAVAAGERRLGKEFFEENKGHFWGLLETRPYMRARYALVIALLAQMRVPEAVSHFEAMIELCPNDNMGVRGQLLPLYLMVDQPEKAAALLAKYEDDVSPELTWGSVLVYYILRDFNKAQKALAAARRWSPRVEKYILHEKKLPRRRPDTYIVGSEDEAVNAASYLVDAWELYPTALIWLHHGGQPGDGKYWGLATGAAKLTGRK